MVVRSRPSAWTGSCALLSCTARRARELDLGLHLEAARQKRARPAKHLTLMGKMPDAEVASRTGRRANAVRPKCEELGIPNPSGPGWTAEELDLLGTVPDAEVAARIGRTEGAVTLKRCRLRIPTFRDRRKAVPSNE